MQNTIELNAIKVQNRFGLIVAFYFHSSENKGSTLCMLNDVKIQLGCCMSFIKSSGSKQGLMQAIFYTKSVRK